MCGHILVNAPARPAEAVSRERLTGELTTTSTHDGHPTRILGVACQDSTSRATSATSSAERSASVEAAFSRTCAGEVAPAITDETTG